MVEIFDWCVRLLNVWARMLGITYQEINVWIFVVIWPLLTVILIVLIAAQHLKIRRLQKELRKL
jgi:hypothetical protein